MTSSLSSVLLFSAIPLVMTALGALVAAWWTPSPVVRSGLQHFAAGVVFSVVAVELLPDVTRVHDPWEVGLSFAAGLGLMLALRVVGRWLGGGEADESASSPGMLVAIGIDILLDGLLVGIAFAAGSKEGLLLTAALSLELLSLGMVLAIGLRPTGQARAVLLPVGLSLLLVVGAVLGNTVLRGASEHTLAGVLAFGSAALLYLVTEELLVEAHEVAETPMTTSLFFLGFLIFLLLGMLE